MNHVHRRYWKLEYLSWHGITLNKSEHVGPTPDFQTLRIHVMVQQGANNMQNWGGGGHAFRQAYLSSGDPGSVFLPIWIYTCFDLCIYFCIIKSIAYLP